MSLKDKIAKEVLQAAKAKDKKRLQALRFLQAAIKNKEIDVRPASLKEEEVLAVLKKQIKQIQESIEGYKQGSGYEDKVKEEEYNLKELQSFLPKALSKEEIKKHLEKAIEEIKPQSIKDMGKVMQALATSTKGAADNKLLAQMVRERLQGL